MIIELEGDRSTRAEHAVGERDLSTWAAECRISERERNGRASRVPVERLHQRSVANNRSAI